MQRALHSLYKLRETLNLYGMGRHLAVVDGAGNVEEEVVVQQHADPQEQVHVEAFAGEDFVDTATLMADGTGEPGYRLVLTAEFGLNHLADMDHFWLHILVRIRISTQK